MCPRRRPPRPTATRLGANDVTVRVRPPPGEFAVGVSRRARDTFTRPRRDATLDSAAIAGDGSSGGGSGDRAVVAVWWCGDLLLVVVAVEAVPRVPVEGTRIPRGIRGARGRPITLFLRMSLVGGQ